MIKIVLIQIFDVKAILKKTPKGTYAHLYYTALHLPSEIRTSYLFAETQINISETQFGSWYH